MFTVRLLGIPELDAVWDYTYRLSLAYSNTVNTSLAASEDSLTALQFNRYTTNK